MKKFVEIFNDEHIIKLRNQLLFSGLSDSEIFMFIQFSKPEYMKLKGGSSVHIANEYSHMIGLVLTGSACVYSIDYGGNKALLKLIQSGESSGTLYAMFDYYNSLVELSASEDSEIIFISPESLLIADESLAIIQQKILANMLASQRQSFLDISEQLTCLSKRSIKGKVMCYLRICCEQEHSNEVDIPYSREEMANYLAVDRASLSRALGELKKDSIIDFRKNHFKILKLTAFNFD